DRSHEACKTDQREGPGKSSNQHQRRHDDRDRDDQPKGCPKPHGDLPAGPHDGGTDAAAEGRGERPRALFCLIAQRLFSTTATTQRDDCAWIITILRQPKGFNDTEMTEASRCLRPFYCYSRRISSEGGAGTCPITCCSRRSAPTRNSGFRHRRIPFCLARSRPRRLGAAATLTACA